MEKKKLDVHLVHHTHWDREWYFTSDDSRTMLYYDMKFLIDHLDKNDDVVFTFDGQSSVIDDFLKFAPDWKTKFEKVVKAKKLFVGPFYTQMDDTITAAESIMRNLETGIHIAKNIGHSMEVGYLPDTFGHNNQIPQILKMNGIHNLSFYRGLDPELTKDHLYFDYKAPDGSSVLAHWQTHYTSRSSVFKYTFDEYDKGIVDDYSKPGEFGPSVKSYEKRNFGLPIAIPLGTDQKPFQKEVVSLTKQLNKKYSEYNFIVSDYETMLKDVAKQIKDNNITLPSIDTELRTAKTGRVHRSIISSRVDLKQTTFDLENTLINEIEPLSVMCALNDIDVPWEMITHAWKDLFKSSAHDSMGASNEDIVNEKIIQRNKEARRVLKGVSAMLSKIYCRHLIDDKDDYKKLIVLNTNIKEYSGDYEIEFTVEKNKDDYKFQIMDGNNIVPFTIVKRNNVGTHERNALKAILNVQNIPALGHKILDIKYLDKSSNNYKNQHEIENDRFKLSLNKNDILLFDKLTKQTRKNFFTIAADPSIGDTYDHSPITFNDKKFLINKIKQVKSINYENVLSLELIVSGKIPNGIEEWKTNKISIEQDIKLIFILNENNIRIKAFVQNKSKNTRLIALVQTDEFENEWKHDQQFGVYTRQLENKYMNNWEKKDSLGYLWDEYPTNLSPHQSWISTTNNNLNIFTYGTKEHELIKWNKSTAFAVTLYRAFGVFGTKHVAYRPGRASGAQCDAPNCQMLDKILEFDFVISFDKMSDKEKFNFARVFNSRAFFIPKAWGLDRTILRWDTTLDFYDSSKNPTRKLDLELAKLLDDDVIQTALYKNSSGKIILRILNVSGQNKALNLKSYKSSFDLKNFSAKSNVELKPWQLLNILLK